MKCTSCRETSYDQSRLAWASVVLTLLLACATAPEVLTSARYDAKMADIWSAGVMLYTMLCCSYPFEKKEDDPRDVRTQTKVMQRIMKGEHPLSAGVHFFNPLLLMCSGPLVLLHVELLSLSLSMCMCLEFFLLCDAEGIENCSRVHCLTCTLYSAADYEWPSSKKVSDECKDLVSRILVADPKRRMAIAEIQVGECLTSLVVPFRVNVQLWASL